MAIYELTLTQQYYNQTCVNRFNYELTTIPAGISGSLGLLFAVGMIDDNGIYPPDTLFQAIRGVQNSRVTYVSAVAFNVYDPVDFFSTPFLAGTDGGLTGDALEDSSPALATSYASGRSRRDIRRGRKAFAGLGEAHVRTGGELAPGFLSGGAETLRIALGETVQHDDEGNILTYVPIICGRDKVELDPGPPPRYTYRYYPTLDQQEENIMNAGPWTTRPNVRTQRSRQYGVGT
jgi:hypothetical protein